MTNKFKKKHAIYTGNTTIYHHEMHRKALRFRRNRGGVIGESWQLHWGTLSQQQPREEQTPVCHANAAAHSGKMYSHTL